MRADTAEVCAYLLRGSGVRFLCDPLGSVCFCCSCVRTECDPCLRDLDNEGASFLVLACSLLKVTSHRTTSSSNLCGDSSVRASATRSWCAPASLDFRHGFDDLQSFACRDVIAIRELTRRVIIVVVTPCLSRQLDVTFSGYGHPDQVFDARHNGHSLDREHENCVLLHTGWLFSVIVR